MPHHNPSSDYTRGHREGLRGHRALVAHALNALYEDGTRQQKDILLKLARDLGIGTATHLVFDHTIETEWEQETF